MKSWIRKLWTTISLIVSYPDVFIQKIIITIKYVLPSDTQTFTDDELADFISLIQLQISPENALNIIGNKRNEDIIQKIQKKLNQGKDFSNTFSFYLKKDYRKHFNIFKEYLSFEKSLSLTLDMKKLREKLFRDVVSEILYPLLLMIISLTGIYFFINLAYPGISSVLSGFDYDFSFLDTVVTVIKIILDIIVIIMIIGIFLLIYTRTSKNKTLIFVLVCKIKKNNFYQKYISNVFIRYYSECVKTGLKTKDVLHLLSELNDPLIVLEAYHLDYSLNRGNDLLKSVDNDFLDERMYSFFKMAGYSDNFEDILDRYIEFSDNSFKRSCRKYARIIMVISYLTIALMIIFIYQILFVPLEILSEL